jgi:Fe2+ or Zn2+ uptake regulation protein
VRELPLRNALADEVLDGKFDHLREEHMASTLPIIDWQKDDHALPLGNEDVIRIMQTESVSRRRAYRILRQRRAAEIDITSVSEGQRVAVLGILINDPEARKDVHTLLEECHAIGVKIDGHDVTKTLFALQHQGFVRFRERNRPRTLYAIVVTDAGHDAWLQRDTSLNYLEVQTQLTETETSVALDHGKHVNGDWDPECPLCQKENERIAARIVATTENARALQQEVNALGAGRPEKAGDQFPTPGVVWPDDMIKRPWIKGDLNGWAMFRNIRDRALRARKLNAAAEMLQEAGGYDDAVLTIMAETEFTPLEQEVKQLLELFGEIE